MDPILMEYLDSIDRYLKPLPAYERADIIKEIQSEMLELKSAQGLSPSQILTRLGEAKALAQAYLGDTIIATERFTWKKCRALIAFYSLAGFGGLFVLPFLSVLSVSLMVSAVIAPLAGLTKLAGAVLGFETPYVVLQIGSYSPSPMAALPVSLVLGLLLFLAGKGVWKAMLQYIHFVGKRRKTILYPSGLHQKY